MTTIIAIVICALLWGLFVSYKNRQRLKQSRDKRESAYEYFRAQKHAPKPQTINCELKGISYRDQNGIGAARLLEKGDGLILQREFDNEHDPFAIKVLTRAGNFIGYVSQDYSESLARQFEYLTAKVASIKHSEIPYIDLQILISDKPTPQPTIETNPNKLSASERMMVLEKISDGSDYRNKIPTGFAQLGFKISWTEELPRVNILRAKACRPGDSLRLVSQMSARYPGRIEIYTIDDILIGYIDEEQYPELYKHMDKIQHAVVHSTEELDRICGTLCLPKQILFSMPPVCGYFDFPYKEVAQASYMAKENPSRALEILQYAIDNEKGINAKEVALKCYWHLKDWAARKDMALRMQHVIDSMNSDELTPFKYQLYKTRTYQNLLKIIETCDKKMQPKKKK